MSHFLHIMVRSMNLDCIVGAEFAIFGGFGWVHGSVLVDEPGLGRVRSLFFPYLGLVSSHFWLNRFNFKGSVALLSHFQNSHFSEVRNLQLHA